MDNLSTEKEPKGPILGIIVIILLLIVGGVYIFLNQKNASLSGEMTATTPPSDIDLGPESTSTEATAVKQEINATNLNNLDAGVNDIQTELNTSAQ